MKIKLLSGMASQAFSYAARLCLVFALASTVTLHAQRKLSNPNASKEAVALYRYIQDMDGKKILSGQMWSNFSGDELVYIQTNTGKQPAIRGMDFIAQSQNNAEVQHAIDWWRTGGIPTIMWHWAAPTKPEGFASTKLQIDIARCFQTGTAENIAFMSELKVKGDLLQKLRDANIPVLWRPFHELNGGWFWWSKGGPAQFKQLWTTMYNYFVNTRGLNNLIWVLCYDGVPDGAWFPGNQFVDIAGADTYTTSTVSQLDMFDRADNATGGNTMPLAYHECGTPPDPNLCLRDGAMWSWWMEWHSSWLFSVDKNYLNSLYHNPLIITKDQVPNILAVYGSSTPPPPPPPPPGPGPVNNGTYSLQNRANGKMLDNLGLVTSGSNVAQWADGNSNNQRWVVTFTGGFYTITGVTGNLRLDSLNHSADGSSVGQATASSSANQQWTLTPTSGGYFKVTNRANGRCLDDGGSSADRAVMVFWASNPSPNQEWRFVAP